jgi:hypothetical protein
MYLEMFHVCVFWMQADDSAEDRRYWIAVVDSIMKKTRMCKVRYYTSRNEDGPFHPPAGRVTRYDVPFARILTVVALSTNGHFRKSSKTTVADVIRRFRL